MRTTSADLLALVLLALVIPSTAMAARKDQPETENAMIAQLLNSRDDDDREDAAKKLGKIGQSSALGALEYAATYDDEGDVREAAAESAREIESRISTRIKSPREVIAEARGQSHADKQRHTTRTIVVEAPRTTVVRHVHTATCGHNRPVISFGSAIGHGVNFGHSPAYSTYRWNRFGTHSRHFDRGRHFDRDCCSRRDRHCRHRDRGHSRIHRYHNRSGLSIYID